ncbi:MAG: DUF1697 domain-containing protein [Sandaracinus sp.]|nr:DUF1697 domain-containing protein [Sandaracinus sp.]
MRAALLLRGVNVGKGNALPMADLRALLEELGCTDVRTYLQSGNAVLSSRRGEAALEKAVGAALAKYMGRPIDLTFRTGAELNAVVDANPFVEVDDPTKLVVTFLSEAPPEALVAPLVKGDWGTERCRVIGREIFASLPDGQGRSPLAAALGKTKLPGTVTTRNWRTVLALREMLDG